MRCAIHSAVKWSSHAQRDQASPLMSHDAQNEQQSEAERRDNREVHGADPGRMRTVLISGALSLP
jgi:hypothetical protein